MESSESEYYKPIKTKVAEILREKYAAYHLEITAKRFSNRLKAGIPDSRHIIFTFLKDVRPDITGFVKEDYSTKFIVVEVKNEALKVDHIYQVKKYAELLGAPCALLISTEEIPEEIKRLSKAVYSLLSLPAYETITLVKFNTETGEFDEWFPKNPFEG